LKCGGDADELVARVVVGAVVVEAVLAKALLVDGLVDELVDPAGARPVTVAVRGTLSLTADVASQPATSKTTPALTQMKSFMGPPNAYRESAITYKTHIEHKRLHRAIG
jgi:hypothetical protein